MRFRRVTLPPAPLHPLSARQYEVLILWGSGNTYKDISEKLNLSEHTIKNTLTRCRALLKSRSSLQAFCKLEEMIGRGL